MPGTAVRWAKYQRRQASPLAAPLGASLAGLPFLTDVFGPLARILVEIAFGADLTADPNTWGFYDVTADVMFEGGGITISPMGRSDETSQAQPAGCALQLLNLSGDYSKNPKSKWWPFVRRNTPLRVRLTTDGTNWSTRYQGEITSFKPSWDTTGNMATVTVSASGVLRRLQQGNKPLRSALERAISTDPLTIEYWPMEDSVGSTQLGSTIPGHVPTSFTDLTLASNTGLPGSAPLPVVTSTGSINGTATATPSTTSWQWDWHYLMPAAPPGGADTVVMQVTTTGTVAIWQFVVWGNGGGFNIVGFDSSGVQLFSQGFTAGAPNPVVGSWVHQSISVQDSGGTITWRYIRFPSLGGPTGNAGSFTLSGVAGRPTGWTVPNSAGIVGTALGHVVEYSAFAYVQPGLPATGYTGETATDRLIRLCREQGIPIEIIGPPSGTAMGPQSVDTFVNLLRECEAADLGMLGDGRGPGLYYITRSSRYNRPASLTLDASNGQLDDPFEPEDDDQRNRNLVTVTRKNGSSATFEDTDGPLGTNAIGVYDTAVTVNIATDGSQTNIAAWLVGLGTIDEPYRYPSLNLDLAATPANAAGWLNTPPTGRVDATNVAAVATQHPAADVSLALDGYNENLTPLDWTAAGNCSPARPWNVTQLDVNFRLDLAGVTLAADLLPGSTSFTVAIGSGHQLLGLKATYPADYPSDLNIGGWQVHVTDCTGGSSPQTLICSATPNTTTVPAGTAVKLWRPAGLAL